MIFSSWHRMAQVNMVSCKHQFVWHCTCAGVHITCIHAHVHIQPSILELDWERSEEKKSTSTPLDKALVARRLRERWIEEAQSINSRERREKGRKRETDKERDWARGWSVSVSMYLPKIGQSSQKKTVLWINLSSCPHLIFHTSVCLYSYITL